MYCCRPVTRRAPSTLRIVQPTRSASASFMPGPFFARSPAAEFNSLFRVLDGISSPRSLNLDSVFAPAYIPQSHSQQLFTITPKFDVQETADSYELRGEVPGVDGSDLTIEFTEPQTLTIRGQMTSESSSGTSPAPAANTSETTQAITSAAAADETRPAEEENDSDAASTYSTGSYQKPSVESAEADAAESSGDVQARINPVAAEASADADATNEASTKAQQDVAKPEEPTSRYWLAERSQGSFQRTFKLPKRIDQDAVKASLRNGILTVLVPKAATPTARKITIE